MSSDIVIRDPASNRGAFVSSAAVQKLAVVGYQSTLGYAAVVDHQEGYVARISRTPTGADDEFFYLYNGSATPIIIDRLCLTDAAAEVIKLTVATGTPVAGTTLVPVNLYSGSTHTFSLMSAANVCESGVDITGLTLGAVLDQFTTGVGTLLDRHYAYGNGLPIVVPTATAVLLSAVTGTAAIVADLYFHFAKEPVGT
jgi:hypothetical protein